MKPRRFVPNVQRTGKAPPEKFNAYPRTNFNAPRRDGVISERSDLALRPRIAGARQPPVIEWMQKPAKPPVWKVDR